MIVFYSTKKVFITTLITTLFFAPIIAQVGIGTTTPSAGSMLDIVSSDKGVLLPRVDIADVSTVAPIVGGATVGLLVYNTNTTTGVGYYYWDGTMWTALSDAAVNEDWELIGNTGTTPGTSSGENYVGTADAQDLIIATNATERIRVLSDGRVSINNTSPTANHLFTATAPTNGLAINGSSTGTGIGVFGQNTSTGTAVFGLNSSTGIAVFGNNTGGGDGLVGQTTSSSVSNGLFAVNFDTGGTALLGGNGTTTYALPTGGSGISASSGTLGLFAYAGNGLRNNSNLGNAAAEFNLDADFDPTTSSGNDANRAFAKIAGFDNVSPDGVLGAADSYYGGYFSGGRQTGNQTFAYVGMRYSTTNNGNNGTDYKIIGTGTVSTLIKDDQNIPRIMFAPEAPEIVFQDYGVGQLVNGEARIALDPILKRSLYVDDAHPLKVYVTLEGDCNGIYVTNKSIDGFTVKELKGGTSNVRFSWQIVANRADTKDTNGEVISKHVGLRLPIGPSYIKPRPLMSKKIPLRE